MLIRGERRGAEVLVTVDGAPLDWRASLAVRSHSPTGPACSYGGSGSEAAVRQRASRLRLRRLEVPENGRANSAGGPIGWSG